MKPAAKYSLITLGVVALLAPVLYVIAVCVALKHHAKEDRIVFGSKQVQEAINEYTEKHGNPPAKLNALVPEFIQAIPYFPEISKVDYRLSANGKEWTLDLFRADRKIPLVYRRTNAGLSSEDAARRIDTQNGCHVLKAPN
jgi:hypothetical protein